MIQGSVSEDREQVFDLVSHRDQSVCGEAFVELFQYAFVRREVCDVKAQGPENCPPF